MVSLINPSEIDTVASMEKQLFDHFWSEEQVRSHCDSGNPIFVWKSNDGAIGGYLIAAGQFGDWEIYRIAVDHPFRRMGIGSQLIAAFCERMSSGENCFLEVRADNSAARKLYSANGFVETGVRKRYYSDGEDAVMMMKSL